MKKSGGAPTVTKRQRYNVAKSLPHGVEVWPKIVKDRELALAIFSRARLAPTGCWEWIGGKKWDSYGTILWKGTLVGAHRMAYQAVKGPIPPGMQVCHKCDNKRCVNPKHLFLGTNTDNQNDSIRKGRRGFTAITKLGAIAESLPPEPLPFRCEGVTETAARFNLPMAVMTGFRSLAKQDPDTDPWIGDFTFPEEFHKWLWGKRRELEKIQRQRS